LATKLWGFGETNQRWLAQLKPDPLCGIRSVLVSRAGMEAARQHAAQLPNFANQAEAEQALFSERDALLRELVDAAEGTETFKPTFQPASLKDLEAWYFQLWEHEGFAEAGISRERLEQAIAMYVGETAVQNDSEFEWFVSEFPFEPGKYQIGIRKPLFSWMLRSFTDLHSRPNNKRRQSIWREFKQYAA
jgi:hypothetical protein